MNNGSMVIATRLSKVCIGSKFRGYAAYICTTTGEYREVLPRIDGDELKLQLSLLNTKGKDPKYR